jgi:hypothetical protein
MSKYHRKNLRYWNHNLPELDLLEPFHSEMIGKAYMVPSHKVHLFCGLLAL